jgi:hypothetical protein
LVATDGIRPNEGELEKLRRGRNECLEHQLARNKAALRIMGCAQETLGVVLGGLRHPAVLDDVIDNAVGEIERLLGFVANPWAALPVPGLPLPRASPERADRT